MPTHNRVHRLAKVLDALEHQTVPSSAFEVVVVSDGSTDGTDDFLRSARFTFRLQAGFQSNSGPAAARNHGVALARGEIVLFVDDDVVPGHDLIHQHLLAHDRASGDDSVVLGPMLSPPGYRLDPFVRWEQAMLYKQYAAMVRGDYQPTYRQFYTGNASLHRKFLVDTGGFDERYLRAEDVELAYRLARRGARFFFNPSAAGYHYAERSFESWTEIARRYGATEVAFSHEDGEGSRLSIVGSEFPSRHPLVQMTVIGCIGHPRLDRHLRSALRAIAVAATHLGLHRLSLRALSGLYNAIYYASMAEALGGPSAFRQVICANRALDVSNPVPATSATP